MKRATILLWIFIFLTALFYGIILPGRCWD